MSSYKYLEVGDVFEQNHRPLLVTSIEGSTCTVSSLSQHFDVIGYDPEALIKDHPVKVERVIAKMKMVWVLDSKGQLDCWEP
jgi:hypothetical protein